MNHESGSVPAPVVLYLSAWQLIELWGKKELVGIDQRFLFGHIILFKGWFFGF